MIKRMRLKFLLSIIFLFFFQFLGETGKNFRIFKAVEVRADVVKKLVCKVDKLNVRVDAGLEANLLYSEGKPVFMLLNQEAEVLSEKNSWHQIRFSFEGKEVVGYVIGTYVEVREVQTNNKTNNNKQTPKVKQNAQVEATILVDALRVRQDAGVDHPQVKSKGSPVSFRKNEKIALFSTKLSADGKLWFEIEGSFEGENVKGYALSDFMKLNVSKANPLKAKLAIKKAFLRKKAGLSGKEVTDKNGKKLILKQGKEVQIFHEINLNKEKYFKVSIKEKGGEYSGYVPAKDLSFPLKKKKLKTVKDSTKEDSKKKEPVKEKTEEKSTDKKNEKKTEEEITVQDSEFKPQLGQILENDTELYNEPMENATILTDDEKGTSFKLKAEQEVKVRKQYTRNGVKWYLITYEVVENGVKRFGAGFLTGDKVKLVGELVGKTTGSYDNAEETSEEEFVAKMEAEGFPASYIEKLKAVHAKHSNWNFKARSLFLDWEDAVAGENKLGLNLIYNSKNVAWKSLEKGAYNWKNDSFVAFDGSSYVTVSEKALRYYMDPRNFLNETDIFQFELLSYQPEIHTEEAIEKILAGSPMENKTYHFFDDGKKRELSYAETFLLAGIYSGVSPFYLASKVKLEVAGGGVFSKSASGDVIGYEGLYNFYNIGAGDSTLPLGAVINGLNFAKNGRKDRPYNEKITFNEYIKLPWTNPYRAILGGAAYIGDEYIRKGQDTLYLEKFNLTENSTFNHQYMSNIEGPYRTASHIKKAYKNLSGFPLTFSIPVLPNMPENISEMPQDEKNPNNYLSKLSVDGQVLEPSFSPEQKNYSIKLGKKVSKVVISAESVSKKASIKGSGEVKIKEKGKTVVKVEVKAENGKKRVYKLTFSK